MIEKNTVPSQNLESIRKKISRNFLLFDETRFSNNQKGYKHAAVLVPIVCINHDLNICLTERSQQVDHHKGQISFPGGMVEKVDQTISDTALRETEEEIGIPREDIEIIGKLDEVYSVTGYLIHPLIAVIKSLNRLTINNHEVKETIYIPIDWILEIKNRRLDDYFDSSGVTRKVWFFSEYQGKVIWGITASILVQFAELINK